MPDASRRLTASAWRVAHSDIFVLNSTAQRYAVSIAVNIASCCSRLERGCTWMAMFGEHVSQRDSFHLTEPVYIFVLSVVCISFHVCCVHFAPILAAGFDGIEDGLT